MQLRVSRGTAGTIDPSAKTISMGSCKSILKQLQPKMRALGIATKRQGKLLGVDYAEGKRAAKLVQKSRLKDVTQRRRRYRQLGRKAAEFLVKTGAAPAIRYGACATGASKAVIKAARRFACGAFEECRGRSAFARLQLADFDIGALLALDPVIEWAKAVWDGSVERQELKDAWKGAMTTVASVKASQSFRKVVGPAGAMVASVRRMGWATPSPFHLMDEDSVLLDLDVVCLVSVEERALTL